MDQRKKENGRYRKHSMRMKLRQEGQLTHMEPNRWIRMIAEWQPSGGRKQNVGRPSMRLYDIRMVARKRWMTVAQDRARWKETKEACDLMYTENTG